MTSFERNSIKKQIYKQNKQFMHPESMLRGLLDFRSYPCQCAHQNQNCIGNSSNINLSDLQANIQKLQHKIDAMNHQVIEVEGLLTQRDMLYNQLDHLKVQRQEIQDQIEQQQVQQQISLKKKNGSRGIKQMNQRLRRRILEVKQYIEKMQNQNQKIQENIGKEQFKSFYSNNPSRKTHQWNAPEYSLYSDYYSPSHRLDKPTNKLNHQYFQGIRKRLQDKQKQAWMRIRKQEEQIENRNARSLINFRKGIPAYNSNCLQSRTYLKKFPKYHTRQNYYQNY